jgi:hypothetical protein
MPRKLKPDNGLDDSPQLMPIGKKSGRGKGWKKYLQSNAVKAGLAGVLVLLLVLLIGWQLMSGGGSGQKSIGTTTSSEPNKTQSAPSPPSMPDTALASPDLKDASADQNGQAGQENNPAEQPAATQPEGEQSEQAQTGSDMTSRGRRVTPGIANGAQTQIPEDVSKWEKADFIRAREENNPKLLEAVEYLGEKNPGSVPVAQQLADLLKTSKTSDLTPTTYARNAMPGLIEATIDALGKNGSQAASQTLMQILSGKFITDNDQAAVDAVLKTLIQIHSDANDDIVVNVLVSPDEIRPVGLFGAQQSIDLHTKALELIKQNTSESLYIKLAVKLVQRGLEANDPLVDFLLQDTPANLSAQLVLYQSEEIPPDTKTKLEQLFLNRSSQAIGLTMGIPIGAEGMTMSIPGDMPPRGRERTLPSSHGPKTQPSAHGARIPPAVSGVPGNGAAPSDISLSKISDYDRGVYLAKLLWGEPLASLMSDHIGDARSFDKSASQIVLASTLPLDSIHAAMFKMLKKRASTESLDPLKLIGWNDRTLTDPGVVLSDPGLIVLLKMVLRSKTAKTMSVSGGVSSSTPPTRAGRYTPRSSSGTGAGGTMGQPNLSEAAQKKERLESDWTLTLWKMVDTWCNRFDTAFQAQKKASRRGQKVIETQPTRFDEFEFPQDAKIAAAYQLNWPEKIPGDMGNVKPGSLKIQYFRLLQTGMPKKTMAAYRRLAKGGDLHETGDGSWLELIKNGSQPNTKRSLDIVVTSADKQPVDLSLPKEESIDLEVAILAIEITDPGAVKE